MFMIGKLKYEENNLHLFRVYDNMYTYRNDMAIHVVNLFIECNNITLRICLTVTNIHSIYQIKPNTRI